MCVCVGVNVLIKRHNIYAYSPVLATWLWHNTHKANVGRHGNRLWLPLPPCPACLRAPRGQVNKSHINSQIIPTQRLQLQPPPPAPPTSFCNALQVNASSSCWLRFAGYGFVSIVTFIDFDVTGRTAVVREGEERVRERERREGEKRERRERGARESWKVAWLLGQVHWMEKTLFAN